MKREEWLLLALASAKGRGLSPVQLQKVLFVLGRELANEVSPGFYNFAPYHYGPFDAEVYRDAELLSQRGLVAISSSDSTRYYSITESGREPAQTIGQSGPHAAVAYLAKVVAWAQSLGFSQLVKSIYAQYPETSVNSVFRG